MLGENYMFKKKYLIAFILILAALIGGCGNKNSSESKVSAKKTTNPIVTIEMEDGAKIKI